MHYYEVWLADSHYHGEAPLTYSFEGPLEPFSVVNVPLKGRTSLAIVKQEVKRPGFATKAIKNIASLPLPDHLINLAQWLQDYYQCTSAEALRQLVPLRPSIRSADINLAQIEKAISQLQWHAKLTPDQARAIKQIKAYKNTTVLLHGETGSGKTRVYMELAKQSLENGCSVILLTPEISLTSQLAHAARSFLPEPVFVVHSQLSGSERKKIWQQILSADGPVTVVGARSALFSPLKKVSLIVVDEAHEPAYKQSQAPYYQASRVASQLGLLTGAKVILGTATPPINDYFLATERGAVVRMAKPAIAPKEPLEVSIVDIKDRTNFGQSNHLSKPLIDAIKTTLHQSKQAIIYLNRRGSARLVLCKLCGWEALCPNCDIPLVYHGDTHLMRCHTCGYKAKPHTACPVCANTDIIYRAIGTKALTDEVHRLFPQAVVARFDSDNVVGERLNELYSEVISGKIDILVGTQLLAKGLDLPHLGLVGIITAETSLALPDFSAEERSFQLLYQVIGRVGRGHSKGGVIIQSLEPGSIVIKEAARRNWLAYYKYALQERQAFGFPPFAYLAQFTCKRTSSTSAEQAAQKVKDKLEDLKLPVQIIGPVAPFYAKRGANHYCQLVLKSKSRNYLVQAAKSVPADWQINLDPIDLL